MSDIALRPRSSTELVDAAFQLYRREPLQFIAALALVYVPGVMISTLIGVAAGVRDAGGTVVRADAGSVAAVVGYAIVPVFSLLAYAIAGGVVSLMANDVYFGRPADLGASFRVAGARFGTMLVALIVTGLLFFLGLVLFIIPGFYAFARFFAVKQVVMLEHGGVGDALARSSSLTVGQKRHVLNTMGLVFLLNLAITIGAALVTGMIPSQVVQLLLNTCISVLVYPIVGITETLLYYDVRIRREGFDIEYLAAAGAPPSSPAAAT